MTVRRKRGQLLLQLCGVTLGTLGLLPAEDDGFERVTALGAKIFENRHLHSLKTIAVCRQTLACHNGRSCDIADNIINAAPRNQPIE